MLFNLYRTFVFITDINECKLDPCVYGKCIDLINNYSCSCDPGYNGRNCSESKLNDQILLMLFDIIYTVLLFS